MPKIRVMVIFGGTNTEHEVSLVSARAVINNLDPRKYDVLPVKITKENTWTVPKELRASYRPVLAASLAPAGQALQSIHNVVKDMPVDVVFPVLHGLYGEDGTIQGMLELMRLPYVGCGVAASAVCMDKVLQKNICASYKIPQTPFFWFTKGEWEANQSGVLENLKTQLGGSYPLFIKPANQGSSIGITKAHNHAELISGISLALTRDRKVLVELAVPHAREIECSLLGPGDHPEVSVLGEIIPSHEFYDYQAKYLEEGSQALIPAKLEAKLTSAIQASAKLAFQALDCWGLARIDFLLDEKTGRYYLNELNTMPGFTPISMFPKLWEASGLGYAALLDRLIELAFARHHERQSLQTSI